MSETWKPVQIGSLGEFYEVSDHGRVRSWKRPGKGRYRREAPHVLALHLDHNGYCCVGLYEHGKHYCWKVHEVVLRTFAGPRPSQQHEASHLNGNRADPRLENLLWETTTKNACRKREHGTMPIGERAYHARLTASAVLEIRAGNGRGHAAAMARKYGVSHNAISKVLRRQTWTHI